MLDRCERACTFVPPTDTRDTCSASSAEACKAECLALIDGASDDCARCLVRGVEFESSPIRVPSGCMDDPDRCGFSQLCSYRGCDFCLDDRADADRCYAETRQEVDCSTTIDSAVCITCD